jgi:cytochrome c553
MDHRPDHGETEAEMIKSKNPFCGIATAMLAASVMTTVGLAQDAPPEPDRTSACIACHAELDDGEAGLLHWWPRDVHSEVGLGCEACHGGDPSPEMADDPEASMDPARGFKGMPNRFEIPAFCGDCHANADYMKRYDPQARVDQLPEYLTSVHGRLNAGGDPVPAVCIDCHGAHGIRSSDSPDSPVFATNVPKMCATCHEDAALMDSYGIPANQYQLYLESVHGSALLERGDNAAPACNDCHGNHGATPPGVQSVANVCGQCHGREAKLFRASFKKELFDSMDVGECAVCHENHGIAHPTPESFRSGSAPQVSAGSLTSVKPFGADFDDLKPGQTVEAIWSVTLPPFPPSEDRQLTQTVVVLAEGMEPLQLDATVRPDDSITNIEPRHAVSGGLSATLTIEALSGIPVKLGDAIRYRLELALQDGEPLRDVRAQQTSAPGITVVEGSACLTCHTLGDECDKATDRMYAALSAASIELREAERLLHAAEVAGMDVGEVQFELNSSGTTAALHARALIHSFDPEQVIESAGEARDIAATALAAAKSALDELQFRRKGLAVSLCLIALLLVGLYLKIREVNRRRGAMRDEPVE